MQARLAAALLLAALAGCARAEPFQARFTVRGRWPQGNALVYRIQPAGGALAPAVFARAIAAALTEWEATGCARFRAARAGEEAQLCFAWERGPHAECRPFGADPSLAHAGPVGPGSFVHFDAERDWCAGGLRQAALHEVGHVLGLDHSPDEESVMYPEPAPERAHLARSDRAGIHSLYGGGPSAPGDLVVRSASAELTPELTLHALAPNELTGWSLFDTDGDGDDEILVWRTDERGFGALWSAHFAPGPRLARTIGPLYGVLPPGAEPELRRTARGERLLIVRAPQRAASALAFDAQGRLQAFPGTVPEARATCGHAQVLRGDLDGDGEPETVSRAR